MTITYEWKIDSLDTIPDVNGVRDVVSKVGWALVGKDASGEYTKHTSIFGMTELPYDQGLPFIEYQMLTPEQVVTWVKNTVGEARVAAYEAHIADILSAMSSEKANQPALPW